MIVKIPDDIYSYENKVFGNFSVRQIVCVGISFAITAPVFIGLYWTTNSIDLSATVAMIAGLPILLCAVFKKDGQHLESVIRYKFQSKFKYPQKRKFIMSNLYDEIQKNQKEFDSFNEKLEIEKSEQSQNCKKRFASLGKKEHRSK